MRAATLFLLALTLRAQDPGRGVNFYSYEKEKTLGAQLAAEYRSGATVIDSPELLRGVEALGNALVPAGSRFSYTFAVAASGDTALHEPAWFPGGYIFVPSGLILAARNIDELVGMMAHAVAHVEARHGTRAATKSELANQASIPLVFMGGWTGYAIRQNASLAVPLGMLQSARAWEFAADSLGARFMTGAGYAPAHLADYIERTQPPDADPPNWRSPLPSRTARVSALRALPGPSTPPAAPPSLVEMQDLLRRALPDAAKAPPRLAR
jgi:predicted Zn-dependent protease